jgi:hypothetical protein
MIQNWMSTCVAGHSCCRRAINGSIVDDGAKNTPLPTRLIEVTPEPRLRITAGQFGQYLALSYCWGAVQTPGSVTTRSTLRQFKQKIPLGALTPTIRDAIVLTQKLGVQYLWVDSLCIVQGDEADWKREAQQMGRIYERAVCTITALGAQHADDGLFLSGNRVPLLREDLRSTKEALLPCITTKGEVVGHVSLSIWPRFQCESKNSEFEDFMESRWAKRGWVLQERLLSRRMVCFGRRQIYWMCMEKRFNEDGTHIESPNVVICTGSSLRGLIPPIRYLYKIKNRSLYAGILKFLERTFHKVPEMEEMWQYIICDYSRCGLTVANDKLIAVAGVASSFASLTGLTYFEGIWLESASFGLSWGSHSTQFQVVSNRGKLIFFFYCAIHLTLNVSSVAPSWSWASSDGPLSFRSSDVGSYSARLEAVISASENGLKILEVTADIIRFASLERVEGPSHPSKNDFFWGWHTRHSSAKSFKICSLCQGGSRRHFYARNRTGQICGLVELDRQDGPPSDFEAILLFDDGVSSFSR